MRPETRELEIAVGEVRLPGDLTLPPEPAGAVIFAHGSGSGRPDLAGDRLEQVTAPTLLIVGGEDHTVLELNREAQRRLRCENDMIVIPGAGHLFEESGALEEVSNWATGWFVAHLKKATA